MHDMLVFKTDLAAYDYLDFPGVVPRSCIGGSSHALFALVYTCTWLTFILRTHTLYLL